MGLTLLGALTLLGCTSQSPPSEAPPATTLEVHVEPIRSQNANPYDPRDDPRNNYSETCVVGEVTFAQTGAGKVDQFTWTGSVKAWSGRLLVRRIARISTVQKGSINLR